MSILTDKAKQKFLEITEQEGRKGQGLRVIVHNGGTSRPEFAMNFVAEDEKQDDDTVVEENGVKIYMDGQSAKFLEGATIEFVNEPHASGFRVDAPNAGAPKPTGPLAEAVMRVLEEKINPAVAGHGGHIDLVAVEKDTAYLRFGGGCQGCGMVKATLKEGVEKVLFEEVPEITKVMDVTDHAAGTNPYYEPGR